MGIPVFISAPRCANKEQEIFLRKIKKYMKRHNLEPRTMGVSEYDNDAPLEGIRRMLYTCCGIMTLAFRRVQVNSGTDLVDKRNNKKADRSNIYYTSSFCHIESAMAYQIGLPLLVWAEAGVFLEGMLEAKNVGIFIHEFDLENDPTDFSDPSWTQPFMSWASRVYAAYRNKGSPPRLWE